MKLNGFEHIDLDIINELKRRRIEQKKMFENEWRFVLKIIISFMLKKLKKKLSIYYSVTFLHIGDWNFIITRNVFISSWAWDMFLLVRIFNCKLQWLWLWEADNRILLFHKSHRLQDFIRANISFLNFFRFPPLVFFLKRLLYQTTLRSLHCEIFLLKVKIAKCLICFTLGL